MIGDVGHDHAVAMLYGVTFGFFIITALVGLWITRPRNNGKQKGKQ
jgi:nitrate reductase gamma subunit